MTGKELIIYILENNLENEDVFKNGKFVGYVTVSEAAVKLEAGIGTVRALMLLDKLRGVKPDDEELIPITDVMKLMNKHAGGNNV